METYYRYNGKGDLIGLVAAVNGDEAWAMAQVFQPGVAPLKPTCMVSGTYWQASEPASKC